MLFRSAIANNGLTDGNPAVINIYRPDGGQNNPPKITNIEEVTAQPGQEVRIKIKARDPEWFPVSFYKALGPGKVNGDELVWKIPDDHPSGMENILIVASDGTSGNNYSAVNATIKVLPDNN